MTRKKILVVDDEEDFTKMVKLNLERTGRYKVREENRGNNAVSAAKEFVPDLILLDIAMPDLDGSEVHNRIRADEEIKDIPVVFLTAVVTESEVKPQGAMIGGHFFLAKPVTVDQLIDCIEEHTKKPSTE